MLGYAVAGLVLGGIYALSAASMVVTYVSALNHPIEQFVHRARQLADECHLLRRCRVAWNGPAAEASTSPASLGSDS
jgi:hypothetical protein